MNLSRIFHCSVINVLCFAVVQQLLYLITEPSACQQLFYFSFFAAVQQLLYLTRSKALCQQLFKIIFCCPLRNISASRVSLTILSCQPIIVNSFFQFIIYFRHALPIHFRTYIEMLLKNSFCLSFKSIYHRRLTVIKTALAYWLFLLGLM